MAKAKKTISVQKLKSFVNLQLNNNNHTMDEKLGMITTIEHVLHISNSYQGFMYTNMTDGVPRFGTPAWVERKYF
jgi:hypothetical protein